MIHPCYDRLLWRLIPMRNLFCLFFLFTGTLLFAQQYDLVVEGGRVMDPETGLDAVRNVGIRDGKIASISASPLSGRRVIHAAGLVVAPGFIDLHQHGQDLASERVKAFDGVTTALEMEIGAPERHAIPQGEGRTIADSLRNDSQPCSGSRADFWSSAARWNHSSKEWASDRSGRHARTDRAHTTTAAR